MNYEDRLIEFQKGKILEAEGKRVEAEAKYDIVIENADFSPTSSQDDYNLTYDAYYRKLALNLDKRGRAMEIAPLIIEVFHKDKILGEKAFYDVAQAYIRINEKDGAFDILNKYINEYPRGANFPTACFEIAKIYHKHYGKPKEAIEYYLQFLNKGKDGKALAAALVSDCYVAIGDIEAAKNVLKKYAGASIEAVQKVIAERG